MGRCYEARPDPKCFDDPKCVDGLPRKSCLKSKDVPEASAKILTETIRRTLQESKLQENVKSRGYNVDPRTTPADLNKLVKEEIEKYARFTPQDLGWKAQ